MTPFYGWGSIVSKQQSYYEETTYFLPLSPQEILVLIWSTLKGWKAVSTLKPPLNGFELRTLDWESKTLTTRSYNTIFLQHCYFIFKSAFLYL